jgi:hypothetical protein
VVVDGGNWLFYKHQIKEHEREQLLYKARVIVAGYNAIGTDAVALGPNDFAAGFDALEELRQAAHFPFLCANLVHRETGDTVFPPTAVIQRDGFRVGLIGVVDSALGARGLGPGWEQYKVAPLPSTINFYAKELAASCDQVVVLSAAPMKKFRALAKNNDKVDFYVAGDPQDKLRIPWKIGNAMVASTTQLGKYLGYAQLPVHHGEGGGSIKHQFVAMKTELKDDPAVKRMVDGYYKYSAVLRRRDPEHYRQDAEEQANLKYGVAVYVSAVECGRCHSREYNMWRGMTHAGALQNLPPAARNQPECLECHVTGLGQWGGYRASGGAAGDPELGGVQCETCHGPGSLHPAAALARPGRDEVSKQCRECHTPSRSPSFRLQDYLERIACSQVEHGAVVPDEAILGL